MVAVVLFALFGLWLLGLTNNDDFEEEKKEKEAFEKQKTKVEVITEFSEEDIKKSVNKFIRDKKVISVTIDSERRPYAFHAMYTATILYE